MSDIELKSCPICGRDVYIGTEDYDDEILDAIICDYCNLKFYGSFSTKEELIKEWNTRKPMERIVEQLQEIAFTENTKEYGRMEVVSLEDALNVVEEEGGVNVQD